MGSLFKSVELFQQPLLFNHQELLTRGWFFIISYWWRWWHL